jgi:hypothetical protein
VCRLRLGKQLDSRDVPPESLRLFDPHTPSREVRSLGFTTLLELSDRDLLALLESDPSFTQALKHAAQDRERLLKAGSADVNDRPASVTTGTKLKNPTDVR